ncbi:MAG: MOSC domain-containing protein [Acidobacteriia bacterium]|nr:MOSC domain-containing protein [Terriglobia bacterium]
MSPGLNGRRLYIPRMNDCAAEAMAAAFRSVGIDAVALPPSDARTLELGARYLAGEECLPAKVTLGDFVKVIEGPAFDPKRTAFMLAAAEGPCRFGQYVPHIRKVFRQLGCPEVPLVSPTFEEGYQELGSFGPELARTGWRAIVASDILRKLLLKGRPYEVHPGDTDAAYAQSLKELCETVETPGLRPGEQLAALVTTLIRIRDHFRGIPAKYNRERLLIGIQGEIFCRLNDFSNEHLIRRLEACGGEAWLSDISEWVWYCNREQEDCFRNSWRWLSFTMLGTKLRDHIQHTDEGALRAPFGEDFIGYEEPEDMDETLRAGDPYLPHEGTSGEMVLSAYSFWRQELPETELQWGMFGENFTTEGLVEDELHIGDRFQIGSAIIMVRQPRVPCYKLAAKFQRDDILERFLHSGRSGFYFSVEREGLVTTGDSFHVISRDHKAITIADMNRLFVRDKYNCDLLQKAIDTAALPQDWREYFAERQQTSTVRT